VTRGQARDVRRVLRALVVTRTAARDLPEVLAPAYRLDEHACSVLHLPPILPPSWRLKAEQLPESRP
jgi:hypothetical protein